MKKHLILATTTVVLVGSVGWFGLARYRCQQRRAAFRIQIKSIRTDAQRQLRIGTSEADISRFFTEHKIPFKIVASRAIGTLQTSGCAPLGCGTDDAIIGVRVELDASGAVAQEPETVDMYTDCL